MAESLESNAGFVECTRCNGEGDNCNLSQVPYLPEECSTMHGVKAGSVIEVAQNDGGFPPPEFPWLRTNEGEPA